MNRLLWIIGFVCHLAAGGLHARSAVLDAYREVVVSRWDFQQRVPATAKLFSNRLNAQECEALARQLTTSNPNPNQDLWALFALGLAWEKVKPGSGEASLAAVLHETRGNIGVNFELGRILAGTGMYQRARAFQKETHRALLEQGYLSAPELAKMELWHARQAMLDGRHQAARQSVEFAGKLDPFSPWVPFLLLRGHLGEEPPWRWRMEEVWLRVTEIAPLLRYYQNQLLVLLNLSRSLRMGFGIFGCVCLTILFARHFFRATHAWAERLPQQVELHARYLAIALVPASLWVGGAGYIILGLLAALVLWKHCSPSERSLLRTCLLGLALMPMLLAVEKAMCRHLDAQRGISLYHQAYLRGYERPAAERTAAFAGQTGEDSLYRAMAATLAYKKMGNYVKAREESQAALVLAPGNPMPLVNAGNLSMLAFDYPGAESRYKAARQAAPWQAEIWFNSSQVQLYTNNSEQHKQFLDRAAEADPYLITLFLKDNDEHFQDIPPNRKVMDPMLRPGQAWTAAWNSIVNLEFGNLPVKTGIFEMPALWLLGLVSLVSLSLFLRFRHYSPQTHGKDLFECRICGRVMCRTCRKGVHCQVCFKTVAGVNDNKIRIDLVGRLKARARLTPGRLGDALNTVFPGTGELYLGVGSGKFAWLLAVSISFGFLFGMNHLVMESPAFLAGPLEWLPWLPLLLLYLLFNLKLLRNRRVGSAWASALDLQEKEAMR